MVQTSQDLLRKTTNVESVENTPRKIHVLLGDDIEVILSPYRLSLEVYCLVAGGQSPVSLLSGGGCSVTSTDISWFPLEHRHQELPEARDARMSLMRAPAGGVVVSKCSFHAPVVGDRWMVYICCTLARLVDSAMSVPPVIHVGGWCSWWRKPSGVATDGS